MKIRTATRVDVAVAARAMFEALYQCKNMDAIHWPWRIIAKMRESKVTRDDIVKLLKQCGSISTRDYNCHVSLGNVMHCIAEIERLLCLPPTDHGRTGYPTFDPYGSARPFFDRAKQEFAEAAEAERLEKEAERQRLLEEAAAASPEIAADTLRAVEYWGEELTGYKPRARCFQS